MDVVTAELNDAATETAVGDVEADAHDAAPPAVVSGMTDLLVKAVRALGAAGEPEQASRIAGKAWWVLKDYPRQAERVNGTMHYLARLEQGIPE
jgi:hypothetical protein